MNNENLVLKLERQFMNGHEVITEISHYLRTPLTIVLSTVSILEIIQDKKINKSYIPYFDKLLNATQYMQQNCSTLLSSIEQLNQRTSNPYSLGSSLNELTVMCTNILILLERIYSVATQKVFGRQPESDEYILAVSQLNQFANQITDLLNSEPFNQHLNLFANYFLICS